MEASATLRSIHQSVGPLSHAQCMLEKAGNVHFYHGSKATSISSFVPGLNFGRSRNKILLACTKKVSDTQTPTQKDDASTSSLQSLKEKKTPRLSTFPNELEALVHQVCDRTEVAELKLKVGQFEMNLKRKIGETIAPFSNVSPTVPPPIPTKPMNESGPLAESPAKTKPSVEKDSPFTNKSFGKSPKLAALESSGSNNFVLVSSPTVGTFQRNRTVKGKKQPPFCKEGDIVKEGQIIGYLNQFGTELPVKSDAAGEILKLLCEDGDAVGYGDPLVAILPSFHDINIQ